MGGDGFLVTGGLDVQGALEAAGCAFVFAENEGEIGAGAGAEMRVVYGTDDATGNGRRRCVNSSSGGRSIFPPCPR